MAPGGELLSPDAARIAAVLAMPDPNVIPVHSLYRAGGQREFPRDSAAGLAKSVSKCHDVNQGLIRAQDKMQREFNLKLRNALILAVPGWIIGTMAAVLALYR